MATINLLNLTTILFILISLFITSYSTNNFEDDDKEEEGEGELYILDAPFANTGLRSRFLASIKKGTTCSQKNKNVCNGVSANKGKSLLYCCKTHCRNILGDRNNCGRCGQKCRLGQLCCGGTCTNVADNAKNCGKCNKACSSGLRCQCGFCGYA